MADEVKRGKLSDLTPDRRNANKGTKRGLGALDHSLRQYGAGRSILIDKHGNIIAGNKTIERAADIGLDDVIIVPTDGTQIVAVQRTDLDLYEDKQARELAYADNRVASLDLDWNAEEMTLDIGAGIDLSPLFTEKELIELGVVQEEPKEDAGAQVDRADELLEKWQVKPGDMFICGEHRIMCGDSRDANVLDRLMDGEKADLVFTDPPYNVAIVGGTHDPRDEKNFGKGPRIENDNMSDAEFDQFLYDALVSMNLVMRPGAVFYVCAPPGRTETQFRNAIDKVFTLRQCIVWAKQQAVFGRQDYHWKHESILYGWKEGAAHYFCDDHTQSTVWEIDRPMRSEKEHPTQKPIELCEKAIGNSSKPGDIVFEPFSGSGTTLAACERMKRKCRAVELAPKFVAVALQRYFDLTGITPILA